MYNVAKILTLQFYWHSPFTWWTFIITQSQWHTKDNQFIQNWFYITAFSAPGFHPGCHTTLSSRVSMLLLALTISRAIFFVVPTNLGSIGQILCKTSLTRIFLFSWLVGVKTKKLNYLYHATSSLCISITYPAEALTINVASNEQLEYFSHPHCQFCSFLQGSHCAQHT